jgi:hypothetical protein
MKPELLNWLASNDTGLSSRAILAHMMLDTTVAAMNGWRMEYPHDPADLGRCIRLMDIEPSFRARILEMGHYSPQWARLAAHWSELEALYHEEVPEHQGRAERTYCRMFELIYEKPHPRCIKSLPEKELSTDARQ